MKIIRFKDAYLQRDILKLIYLFGVILGVCYLFILNPTLSTPTLCSLVFSALLSPLVAALERRGYPRAISILLIFLILGAALALTGAAIFRSTQAQFAAFKQNAPAYFQAGITKLQHWETSLKEKYSFLSSLHLSQSIVLWGENTGKWFVDNGAELLGDILTWIFLVPLLTYFMLSDGPTLRRKFFQLVPNRFFEITLAVTSKITATISDYLSAKLIEALLVGILTSLGLALINARYALVLGVIAGVTNIIPYIGPLIGAVPGVLIAYLDSGTSHLTWLVVAVYAIANLIDMLVIFPIIVAKLVNLHPLLLIVAVTLGQQYYGLIGMLISIPIASAIKVILNEIYVILYGTQQQHYSASRHPE